LAKFFKRNGSLSLSSLSTFIFSHKENKMKKLVAVAGMIVLMSSVAAFAQSNKGKIETMVNEASARNMNATSNGEKSTAAAGSIAIKGNENNIETMVNAATARNMNATSNAEKSTAAAGSIALKGASDITTMVNEASARNMNATSNGTESTAAAGSIVIDACENCQ
jgi:hypothetical protein